MTDPSPKFDRQAFMASLGLSIVVDIDRVFDALPEIDADLVPLADPAGEQWRPIFLGAPGTTHIARTSPFATLSAVGPDGPNETHADLPDMPAIPPEREWAVMTYGFKTRRAAAIAGITWANALAKVLDAAPGEGALAFVGVAPFPPDWRGYS